MQQEKGSTFSLSALGLGLVTASLAEQFYSPAGEWTARSTLLLGFLSTSEGLFIQTGWIWLFCLVCHRDGPNHCCRSDGLPGSFRVQCFDRRFAGSAVGLLEDAGRCAGPFSPCHLVAAGSWNSGMSGRYLESNALAASFFSRLFFPLGKRLAIGSALSRIFCPAPSLQRAKHSSRRFAALLELCCTDWLCLCDATGTWPSHPSRLYRSGVAAGLDLGIFFSSGCTAIVAMAGCCSLENLSAGLYPAHTLAAQHRNAKKHMDQKSK